MLLLRLSSMAGTSILLTLALGSSCLLSLMTQTTILWDVLWGGPGWQGTESSISVPVAAVTNYHKLGGVKQQKCILSFLETRSLKSVPLGQDHGVHRAVFLEAVEENLFLASSSFWWLLAFLDLWSHHSNLCLYSHIVFSHVWVKSPSASLFWYMRLDLVST